MKTAGEILKAGRNEKGWTIAELSGRTKIQERFIKALENSDLAKLPAMPFVNGFLRTISAELDLKPEGIVAIFRRDFGEDDRGKVIPNALEKKDKGFRWAPSTSIAIGIFAILDARFSHFVLWLKFPPPNDREPVRHLSKTKLCHRIDNPAGDKTADSLW